MTLPPLPEEESIWNDAEYGPVQVGYTAYQMQAYGQQCYQAAVDKAAAYIDSRYDPCPESFKEHMK